MIHDEEGKKVIERILSKAIPATQEHLGLYNPSIITDGLHPIQIGDLIITLSNSVGDNGPWPKYL